MGLWQNIKDTYNYYKQERAQQDFFQGKLERLHEIENQPNVNPIQSSLDSAKYRDQMAKAAPQRAKEPEKSNWLGRMAARLRFGADRTTPEYEEARATFSMNEVATHFRNEEIQDLTNEAQVHNRHIREQFQDMGRDYSARETLYRNACGDQGVISNAHVNRIGPAIMEVPTGPADEAAVNRRNKETVDLMREYDGFLKATEGSTPIPNPERFQEVSQRLSEKIKPLIEQGNSYDPTQYRADPKGYAWATPEQLTTMKNQYHTYMVLYDWAKTPADGPAAADAFGTPEAFREYQVNTNNMAQAYFGLRGRAMADMINPTVQDTLMFAHSPAEKTELTERGVGALQSNLANKAWMPFDPAVTPTMRNQFQQTLETFDPNRNARINPPQKDEPQKINMNQLGERAGMATPPATQRPDAAQQAPQPKKEKAMGK